MPEGDFYNTGMPFGLKNAGATYQHTMTCVLGDPIHHAMECCTYDVPVDEEEELGVGTRVNCHAMSISSSDEADTLSVVPHQQHSANGEPSDAEELSSISAPQELEDGGQPTIDNLVQVNLGTEDDPHPTFVSATLTEEEQEDY